MPPGLAGISFTSCAGPGCIEAPRLRPGELEAERVVFRRANLEDVFLRLTGRGLAQGE